MNKKLLLFLLLIPVWIIPQSKDIIAYYLGVYSSEHLANEKILESRGTFDKITVLNYSFAYPLPDSSGKISSQLKNSFFAYQELYSKEMSVDGYEDDSSQALRGQFNQLRKLKLIHPQLKIMLSFGGWGGSKYFSDLALTTETREYFVDDCIDKFIKGNLPIVNGAGGSASAIGVFDGIDLDWEFPISGGPDGTHNNENDRENHTELFKLFRQKLNEINPNLLLTAAVSGRSFEFWKYNFTEDQKYLDWFNLMSYDLHGIADSATWHHTNLLSSPFDPDSNKESLDRAVKYLIDSANVKPNKIAPGAAFYGKGWSGVDIENNGLFIPGKPNIKWGYISFKNHTDFDQIKENGFDIYWDDYSLAPYLYNKEKKIFWTYDDIRSVVLKSRYVDAYGLRGLMFWQIFGDDSLNTFINSIYTRNMPDVLFNNSNSNSTLPQVSISILNKKALQPGQNIIFIITPENDINDIVKVEYFLDEKPIGYNTMKPFTWAWFNSNFGNHTIYCTAYNSSGEKFTSEQLNFVVKNK